MSERYSKLFALSENQYAGGSPVVIAAGALLKDNQTGKVIAQLKLRNISSKRIKAATVCIVPFDTVGNPIGDFVSYQYLDLSAKRDEDFGQKAAITLPNAATRSFAATVEEIAFVDNTIWKATGEPWEVLPVPSSIGRVHGAELEKQFRMKYGADSKNLPLFEKDLWYCACGALNRIGEPECHICGKSYAEMSTIDYDALHREKNVRVAAEKEQAEKEAAAARDREEAAKAKAKKVGKIAAIVVSVFAVIIVVAVIVSGMMKKNDAYNNALALMDAGQYEEAITAFTALDGYKDSAEQIQLAENAIAEIERMKREAEIEAAYNNAVQLLNSDVSANENEAYHILTELGDYKNAQELLSSFQYQIISEEGANRENLQFYEYDSTGLLTEQRYDGGAAKLYDYDENGRITKEYWDTKDRWATTEYWYNENGTVAKTKYTASRSSSGIIRYLTIEYNENGHPIKIDDDLNSREWLLNYVYAQDGDIESVECIYKISSLEESLVVNLGDIDENANVLSNANTFLPTFTSRSNDGLKEESYSVKYYGGLQLFKSKSCIYDSYGNLTTETQYDTGNYAYRYDYDNDYDEMGNLIQVVKKWEDGTERIYSYTYGYIYTPDAE